MEVILLERIEKLGQMGDVVNVKPGFARNFLLPQNKALRATDGNKSRFEAERTQLEGENLKRREEAQSVGDKLEGLSVVLVRQAGDAGQLYGSVSARDIADSVVAAGFTISRSQVILDRPIKTIGIHEMRVILHPEVTVTISTNVARSEEEAAIQAKTGAAVIASELAEAQAAAEEAQVAAEEIFEEGAAPDDEPADDEASDSEEAAAEETPSES